MMNCEEFERLWQVRLDARETPDADAVRELERHAAACAGCEGLAAGFALLNQAIGSLPRVSPPAGFAERCAAEASRERARVRNRSAWVRYRRVVGLAAAASLLIAVFVGVRFAGERTPPPVVQAPRPSPLLSDALADATSATWDLALEASAPAARVGRGVLSTAVETAPSNGTRFFGPSTGSAASDALEAFGERVNAGVQPLSGSAKHAFGFLFGPALDDEPGNPRPS